MEKLVGYARVSTNDQDPSLQIDALQKAGVLKENIFIDYSSGAKADRPELTKCLKSLKEDDTLVIWKLDRLGRSLSHLIEWINKLGKKGVHFKSLTESIDTSTAGGELMFHMMGAFAQFERSIIVERTKAGLSSARKKGRLVGRPKLKKTDESFAKVKRMKNAGFTPKEIAYHTGMHERTVYRRIAAI